jgi:hypothetical protein
LGIPARSSGIAPRAARVRCCRQTRFEREGLATEAATSAGLPRSSLSQTPLRLHGGVPEGCLRSQRVSTEHAHRRPQVPYSPFGAFAAPSGIVRFIAGDAVHCGAVHPSGAVGAAGGMWAPFEDAVWARSELSRHSRLCWSHKRGRRGPQMRARALPCRSPVTMATKKERSGTWWRPISRGSVGQPYRARHRPTIPGAQVAVGPRARRFSPRFARSDGFELGCPPIGKRPGDAARGRIRTCERWLRRGTMHGLRGTIGGIDCHD